MHSFFHSPSAKAQFEYLYFEKLDSLGIDYEMLPIETSYGDTNIIIAGTKGKPGLVALDDRHASAVFTLGKVLDLLSDYRVYAIDIVGQPNLSEEVRPDKTKEAYGQWMFELLSRLRIQQANLLGWGLGAFIIWKALQFDEKRIGKAFLIKPTQLDALVSKLSLTDKSQITMQQIQMCWSNITPHNMKKRGGVSDKIWELLQQEYIFDRGLFPTSGTVDIQSIKTPIYLLEDRARIQKVQLASASPLRV